MLATSSPTNSAIRAGYHPRASMVARDRDGGQLRLGPRPHACSRKFVGGSVLAIGVGTRLGETLTSAGGDRRSASDNKQHNTRACPRGAGKTPTPDCHNL